MVVPNNHGFFLLKMIILGCEMGVPPFKGNNHICYTRMIVIVVHLVHRLCEMEDSMN